jgi:hypothetical protein
MGVIALILNILGTIIIAFSTKEYFKSINNSLIAHETSIRTMFNSLIKGYGDIYNISGTTEITKKTLKKSNFWMVLGVLLLVIGFSIQATLLIYTKLQ